MFFIYIFEIVKCFTSVQISYVKIDLISSETFFSSLILIKVEIKGIKIMIIKIITNINLLNIYFCCFSICGVNQYNQKKIVLTIIIATRLVRNNIIDQIAKSTLKAANAIQTTTSGGINEAAIATHAIDSQSLVNLRDITATIAENIAIKKSITFGELRVNISHVSIFTSAIYETIAHISTDKRIEYINTFKAIVKNF
jgi:hypothetical protein